MGHGRLFGHTALMAVLNHPFQFAIGILVRFVLDTARFTNSTKMVRIYI